MEARNRPLPDWFTKIRTRQISLPRFQRFEAWSHHQVTGLLNTVLQELPAGAVLTLEIGDSEPFVSRTMVGAPENGEKITEHLLDGQQRLTALWRSLNDYYNDRSYFVKLEKDEETGAPYYAVSYSRWYKNDKKYPLWLNDSTQLWENRLIPVLLLRPDTEAENQLDEWAEKASSEDRQKEREIIKTANRLRQLFAKFNIPFLSLPITTRKETALNVFIQTNTSASPLTAYDIVVAQVEASAGLSLHELSDDLKKDVTSVESYTEPSDLMLAVSALLQDKPPTKSTYLSRDFSPNLVKNWEQTKKGIIKAIKFLEDERVFDSKRLPSDVSLYPLSALWSIAPEGLDKEGESRTILRKYLWRSFFTNRYERTSATRALVDFRQIGNLINSDHVELPIIFNEEEHPLPSVDELKSAGWPVRKDRLARALLALAIRAGGLDFADGSIATRENLKAREYHHLFPDAWLKENGYTEQEIFKSLNCALVTWKTNRNISAKSPSKYIEERMEGTSLGEEEVKRRLNSHLIPYEQIQNDDYKSFLDKRAESMYSYMIKLCNGETI